MSSYPYCLELLALLQHASFRQAVASSDAALFIHQKEFYHWQWLGKELQKQHKVMTQKQTPADLLLATQEKETIQESSMACMIQRVLKLGSN